MKRAEDAGIIKFILIRLHNNYNSFQEDTDCFYGKL